jgi:MFS family permease
MMQRFRRAWGEYPRQFWLMFFGMMISTIGSSMIWPFLMVYVSGKLKLPLATLAGLMTISSVMGLVSSLFAGPIIDRAGRKWAMVLSLLTNAFGYLLMSQAHTLVEFGVIMALNGAVNPIFRVSADAMMADLIPPEKRIDAYSLMRMSNNVGISLGPAIGGFITSTSYTLAFILAAAGMSFYSLLMTIFARETLPQRDPKAQPDTAPMGGYGEILKDRAFMPFVGVFTLVQVCAAMIWVLLAVYAKTNYGVPESQYGLIPTTNALMVVFLQFAVTRVTRRFRTLPIMATGALFYTAATLSIAFGQGFWAFWISMVIMTIGELILMPTSSTLAANLAPADKRGRYMGVYGLTWLVAAGTGPTFGGFLNDNLGPRAIWLGGALVGLISIFGFLLLARRERQQLRSLPLKQ